MFRQQLPPQSHRLVRWIPYETVLLFVTNELGMVEKAANEMSALKSGCFDRSSAKAVHWSSKENVNVGQPNFRLEVSLES